ncbi:group II intron maturase-specific domain-containing protein [Oligella ureolytica]|uniref:group II intron maturase-specific domain-containing protein n=1 Tax=Oligella ureolytica TaxID=90244 RepID=UPI001C68C8EA|nr:group II intron maturase-specific domain-containing protein [Oligella ureolytica]
MPTKKLKSFKQAVKGKTPRNSGKPLRDVIHALNPLLRGFSQYFRIANAKQRFSALAHWIRRRLRSIQLKLWKKPQRLHRRLKQLGYQPPFKAISMRTWRNAASPLVHYAMPNEWFTGVGLYNLEEVETGKVFSVYAEW